MLAAVLQQDVLTVANCGDCRAVLVFPESQTFAVLTDGVSDWT